MTDPVPRRVIIVGDKRDTRRQLDAMEAVHPWRLHNVLDYETCEDLTLGLNEKIARVMERIEALEVAPDGICGYWDFPQMAMVSLLAARLGLPAASLESVLRCQHKYWARILQQEVVPEVTPRFVLVDPERHRREDVDLPYPFWLKPVRAHSSQLGFRIDGDGDLDAALARMRRGLLRCAPRTDEVLRRCRLPEEIARVDGRWCIAESLISGENAWQCTAEGYALEGQAPEVYGIVDSLTYEGRSSFLRYQYPSSLPDDAKARIRDVSRRVISHIGLENGMFNIEFYWDDARRRLSLLEINPRISQSHALLFRWVDGVGNIERAIRVALGEDPRFEPTGGPHPLAAKCFVRLFRDDAVVKRAPSEKEVRAIEADIPGLHLEIPPRGHRRLSDMIDQDSYSYEIALAHVGADSEAELLAKLEAATDRLDFHLEDPTSGERIDHRRELSPRR
jgi:hypothetical protein